MSQPDACAPRTYASAYALFQSGQTALAVKRFAEASQLFDQALDVLGYRYFVPGMLDDTGMHLVLARSRRVKEPAMSARSTERIAAERFELYRRRCGGR